MIAGRATWAVVTRGSDTSTTAPILLIDSDPFVFPATLIAGDAITTKSLTLTNTGNADLIFGSPAFQISGIHAGDFAFDGAPDTSSLLPGESRSVTMAFNPSNYSLRTASVEIYCNDAITTHGLTLRSSGVINFGPRPYDGIGPGVSTIGAGGFYRDLSVASRAINAHPLFLTTGLF